MAFSYSQAFIFDDPDVPSELEDEVFVSQGKRVEQEILLGSRLEDELNRSITKLRELERSAVSDNIRLAHLLSSDSGSNSPHSPKEELLEDIEMPVFSPSGSCSSELVSLSSGSPSSPPKHHSSFWDGTQNSSLRYPVKRVASGSDSKLHFSIPPETSSLLHQGNNRCVPATNRDELLDDIDVPALNSSDPDCADLVSISTGSPSPMKHRSYLREGTMSTIASEKSTLCASDDSKFKIPTTPTDLAQKIWMLSFALPPKLARLVSVNENGLQVSQPATGGGSSAGSEGAVEKISPREKSANMTSSPISSSEHPSLSFLNLDEINDSLLSSSLITSPIKKPIDGMPEECLPNSRDGSGVDIEERIKKLCEELKPPTARSTHNPEAEETLPSLSPSNRMTLGGACNVLNIEELNDSLLSSFRMAKSPILEEDYDFPLPAPLAEVKKKDEEQISRRGHIISKLESEGLERLLNETHSVTNKSRSLGDLRQDIDNVFALDKTFGSLGNLESGPDNKKTKSSAKPLNDTFNAGGNSKELSKKGTVEVQAGNSTFGQISEAQNETFCARAEQGNLTFDSKQAKTANTTFDLELKGASEKCDKDVEVHPGTEGEDNHEKSCEKLNVTFERGEYHIASLNETVNLMDAEGDVFKMILDSTPLKSTKIKPDAVSTPKGSGIQDVPAKNTVTKDPAQSFIHRMSLGVRKNAQNAADSKQDKFSTQPSNLCAPMPGLKGGCVNEQSVTNKLRRFQGGQGRIKNGPMRALPLACMSGDTSGDEAQKNTPDGLDGIRALDNISNTPEEIENKALYKGIGRPHLPSFGSCSSIENERPSTPDLIPTRGIMTSTPDVNRPDCANMCPRITSTPATKIGPFSDALGIEGQAPTPIAAPPSRSRFIVSTTSSIPEQQSQDNPSLENLKGSFKSGAENVDTSAKKSLMMSDAPFKTGMQEGICLPATTDSSEGNLPKYGNTKVPENVDANNAQPPLDADRLKDCSELLEGEGKSMNENFCVDKVPQSIGEEDKNQENSEEKPSSHRTEDEASQVSSSVRKSEEMQRYQDQEKEEALDEPKSEYCAENVPLKLSEERESLDNDTTRILPEQKEILEVEEIKDDDISGTIKLQAPLPKELEKEHEKSLQSQPKEIESTTELPRKENYECPLTHSQERVGKDKVDDSNNKDLAVISEIINETRVIDQPKEKKLNQVVSNNAGIKDKGLIKKPGPVSKINNGMRRSTVEKPNAPSTENKVSSVKNKINANKENIQVNQPNCNSSSPSKVLTGNKNQKLGAKLPSQRISLAPSNGQTKKSVEIARKRSSTTGNVVLRSKYVVNKEAEMATKETRARPSLARQSVKTNPVKPSGMVPPPSLKGKENVLDSTKTRTSSRLQPPTRISQQPQESSKLPLGSRSYSGNPIKGTVRGQGNSSSKLPSKVPSKLPITSSKISVPSTKTAAGAVSFNNSAGFSRIAKRP